MEITGVLTSMSAGAVHAAPVVDVVPWPAAPFGGEKALENRYVEKTTEDGWVLHAEKKDEVINVAPPLDSAATTGESFGSLKAKVWITGQGEPELQGAVFEAGYQVGCGVDISTGVDYEVAGTVGVAPRVSGGVEGGPSISGGIEGGPSVSGGLEGGPNVGVGGEAGPSVSVNLPEGNVQVGADGKVKTEAGADATAKVEGGADATGKLEAGADATGKLEGGVDAKAEVSPAIKGHLQPGKITNVALVSMPIDKEYKRAAGGFTGAHLQVNGCAGPVTVRSYVTISTVSPTSIDAVNVYGDPQRIR
ncbi:MspA family porin [Corynebacterium sp. 21KM1197]|uniref:MspA family porin n=1 Tax=Corynebacterium sp. 21KM1197 TaxID=2989734 RepID=UPI0029C9F43D|nr:MspA family porin [Corynebacterium sp. 21KM1197]WPF67686.1 MspA family porin [Corynebacterium sp. 21KM1197]